MPTDAYNVFLDKMAKVARKSMTADRIRQFGHPVRSNDEALPLDLEEQQLKTAVMRLPAVEKEALARAFVRERVSALHDFAAFLEWAASCENLSIHWRGETFGGSTNETMHGDLIARLNDLASEA
jgi:hypothetical protein